MKGITKDPIEQVREGMNVYDTQNQRIGSVVNVKIGDPEAITTQGQQPDQPGGMVGALMDTFSSGSGMPDERKERLLRLGYLEINGAGIGNHFYESAEAIDRVTEAGVFLNSSAAGTTRT